MLQDFKLPRGLHMAPAQRFPASSRLDGLGEDCQCKSKLQFDVPTDILKGVFLGLLLCLLLRRG